MSSSKNLCTFTVYLFTQGRWEGGELNQREGERGNSSQRPAAKSLLQVNFFYDDSLLLYLYSELAYGPILSYFFMRAKLIIGYFERFFREAKNFLTPKFS
jgi:hypothetical protein